MSIRVIEGTVPRILPSIGDLDRPFWTGGRDGRLMIQRCSACRRWQHPPTADGCPECGGEMAFEAASGRGTVFTYTVNHQQFHPEVPPPYVIAIVELAEQPDLRLPTNLVDVDPDDLACGMPVQVLFERSGDVYVPLFQPVTSDTQFENTESG
jgi:uncharacterized OB-fold protein